MTGEDMNNNSLITIGTVCSMLVERWFKTIKKEYNPIAYSRSLQDYNVNYNIYFSVNTVNLNASGSKFLISSSIKPCPHFT